MGAKPSIASSTSTSTANLPAASSANGTRARTFSVSTPNGSRTTVLGRPSSHLGSPTASDASRQRARSLTHVPAGGHHATIGIPALGGGSGIFDISGSPDSDGSSTPDEPPTFTMATSVFGTRVYAAHSLPTQLSSAFNGIKCPVCSKFVIPDDIEYHLVMCLTKPRISYNEDVLSEDKEDECVICLDDLKQGDTIARLPCLCIYHKSCIDSWFEVNRSCPEHPLD